MDNQGYPEQRYVVTALLRYLVAAVLFVALVAIFAWFFLFRGTDTSGDKTARPSTGTSQNQTNDEANRGSSDDENNDPNTTNDDTADNSGRVVADDEEDSDGANSRTTTDDEPTTETTDELANTGPGEVALLFLAATVIGASARRYQLNRRTSN